MNPRDDSAARLKSRILGSMHALESCCSTRDLAMRLQANAADVKQAVKELHADGILGYCESFGFDDLCFLDRDSSAAT